MMARRTHLPLLLFGSALTLIYAAAFFIVQRVALTPRPDLVAAGVTLDITVVVPLFYYGLLVRRNGWPIVTVAPVFLLSLIAATWIVPETHQGLLQILQLLIAPLELVVLGYIGVGVTQAARRFRAAEGDADVYARLQTTLRQTLGVAWAANAVAFEIGLLYYALFTWRQRPDPASKRFAFSYHQRCGYGSVLAAILVAMLIELIALHLLVSLWSPAAAWVLTALSGYGILWFLGDFQAARLRPIRVEKDALLIRTGLRWTLRVPFEDIAWVRPVGKKAPTRKVPGYLEAILLGRPAYLVASKHPLMAQGLYGMQKQVRLIGLAPDDPDAFEEALRERYTAWQPGSS